jgi:cobalt-zinc-cadmium efflux system protein
MIKKNMLIAFVLNIFFTILEIVGGILTNSISILSDALHDFGDSLSIGLAFLFEKKSFKNADKKYTYGYVRYSVLGALVTTSVLLVGSVFIIIGAINRLINPEKVVSWGVLVLAVLGITINAIAYFITTKGKNLNEKAINLHLFEDLLGWIIVFVGGVIMQFTGWYFIDPILSLLLASFILFNVFVNLKNIFNIFLQKAPVGFDLFDFQKQLSQVEGVEDVYHIHVWTLDGNEIVSTFHIKLDQNYPPDKEQEIKFKLKEKANQLGVGHTTVEIDNIQSEDCCQNIKSEKEALDKYHHGVHHGHKH